ncbi:putative Non-classical export protein 2 [Mollisia scopiformis]|uniref:Putative Non-classical export protein 2 n=1 Tax=Mollisia scopiformis TaxID=149040 RepID=A0A194XEI5_MOLSC|nr:putative Non-classical export protein 2 [Mollisia scopiformis]KUJ18167.1 putative Non-classical export protein 2 [Mollisia scopiformis]
MVSVPQIALRGWEFLWTLITMALIGNVIATAFAGNPSSINYAIFVTVWDMLVVLFGIGAAFMDISAAGIILAVGDIIAALLTFIAGVVLAAKLGVHSCSNGGYTSTNHLTNGSHDTGKRCRELQASTAFFWFLLPAFAISAFLSFKNSGGSSSMRGGIRRGGPSMSQV